MNTEKVRRAISRIIEACHTSTLVTVDSNGRPWARQMSDHNIWPQDGGPENVLWLQTSARTHKIKHLQSNHKAGLYYFRPDEREYVYASGSCRAVSDSDLREKYFRETLLEYWPEGPTAPDYVLLRFDIETFVYYPGSEAGHFPLWLQVNRWHGE
ncbi:MAG: pyridoxamine 5'-phosphate oxidase family protein [Armatimonadota bacterium]